MDNAISTVAYFFLERLGKKQMTLILPNKPNICEAECDVKNPLLKEPCKYRFLVARRVWYLLSEHILSMDSLFYKDHNLRKAKILAGWHLVS